MKITKNIKIRTHKQRESVLSDNSFDKQTGLIISEPQILKFHGFQVAESKNQKVYIKNTSKNSLRIKILPMISNDFTFIYDKKGNIAPGMNQEIQVSLMAREYKVYETNIRILSENDVLTIPIIAYPIINEDYGDIFPKFIDFNKKKIGRVYRLFKQIQSKIPLNFRFEFKEKNKSNEIQVMPLKGIIPGNGSVNIQILYKPKKASTINYELELYIDQYDFQPIRVKIMGSGTNIEMADLQDINQEKEISKNQNSMQNIIESKTLLKPLKNKKSQEKSMNAIYDEKNIENNDFEQNKENAEQDINSAVQDFLKEFEKIKQKNDQKQISIVNAIGEDFMSDERMEINEQQQKMFIEKHDQQLVQNKLHIRDILINSSIPTYDLDVKIAKVKWDQSQNNLQKLKKLNLKTFSRIVNKIIIRQRCDKRLKKLMNFVNMYNAQQSKNNLIETDLIKNKFETFQTRSNEQKFGKIKLKSNKQKTFNQINNQIEYYDLKLEDSAIQWSEDLFTFSLLSEDQTQLNDFQQLDLFQNFLYFPYSTNRIQKQGAEDEDQTRTQIIKDQDENADENADENIDNILEQILDDNHTKSEQDYNKMCNEQKWKQYMQDSSCQDHVNYYQLINICDFDCEKLLQFKKENVNNLYLMQKNKEVSNFDQEFLSISPGYSLQRWILWQDLEKYHDQVFQMYQIDNLKKYNLDKNLPKTISNIEKDDQLLLDNKHYENQNAKLEPIIDLQFKIDMQEKLQQIQECGQKNFQIMFDLDNQKKIQNCVVSTAYSDINKYIKDKAKKLNI